MHKSDCRKFCAVRNGREGGVCFLVFALSALLAPALSANSELDELYGFRRVGAAVLQTDANPIFASQVQRALETELGLQPRFEVSNGRFRTV